LPGALSDGFSADRVTLGAFAQLLVDQGFISRLPHLEGIFVPVEAP
jgi:hypothetical protein